MRSFRDINKILETSKELCDKADYSYKDRLTREKAEKFKENYFLEVDKFISQQTNNFKNRLPILILIQNNKDNFFGELLIRHVAFPVLCMPYPEYQNLEIPYKTPAKRNRRISHEAVLRHQENEVKHRQEFTSNVNAKLNTALKTLTDNEGMKSVLQSCSFFPAVVNNLISEYVGEDPVEKYDLLLRSVEIGLVKFFALAMATGFSSNPNFTDHNNDDMQKARENGTPILTRLKIEHSDVSLIFLYGNYDGNGAWTEVLIANSSFGEAAFLYELPYGEGIMKSDDILFTDLLMETLKVGHTHSIDYSSPVLRR